MIYLMHNLFTVIVDVLIGLVQPRLVELIVINHKIIVIVTNITLAAVQSACGSRG